MATTLSHPLRSGSLTGSIIAGRALLEKFPTSILALAFRFAVAVVFFRSGLTKIASWDATVALFDMEYMVPVLPAAFAAYLATATELGASALVACGLFTRFAAAPEQPAEQQGHADDSAGQGKGDQINQNFAGQQKGQELQESDQHVAAPVRGNAEARGGSGT